MASDTLDSRDVSPSGTKPHKVQAAEVGTGILKALAELAPSTSLSGLAEHVGMPAAKVHRYLQALIASGFAEQDPSNNHYGLGREALLVGLAALRRLDVLRVAAPHLERLRDALNETCFLAVWGNKGPTVVHVEQSFAAVTLVTKIGSVLPLLTSSTGMVFASFLHAKETSALLSAESEGADLQLVEQIQNQMAQIRATGLNHVCGLLMPGVNAVSAPLFSTGHELAGVMTVVGAASVFTPESQKLASELLREASEAITLRMGGVKPA